MKVKLTVKLSAMELVRHAVYCTFKRSFSHVPVIKPNQTKPTHTQVSSSLWGYLADAAGRRHVIMLGVASTLGFGLGAALLAPTFAWLSALLFLCGVGQTSIFQTCFILAVENVGKRRRVLCGIVIEFFFVAGEQKKQNSQVIH